MTVNYKDYSKHIIMTLCVSHRRREKEEAGLEGRTRMAAWKRERERD